MFTPSELEIIYRLVNDKFHEVKDIIGEKDQEYLSIMNKCKPEKKEEDQNDYNFVKTYFP